MDMSSYPGVSDLNVLRTFLCVCVCVCVCVCMYVCMLSLNVSFHSFAACREGEVMPGVVSSAAMEAAAAGTEDVTRGHS